MGRLTDLAARRHSADITDPPDSTDLTTGTDLPRGTDLPDRPDPTDLTTGTDLPGGTDLDGFADRRYHRQLAESLVVTGCSGCGASTSDRPETLSQPTWAGSTGWHGRPCRTDQSQTINRIPVLPGASAGNHRQ